MEGRFVSTTRSLKELTLQLLECIWAGKTGDLCEGRIGEGLQVHIPGVGAPPRDTTGEVLLLEEEGGEALHHEGEAVLPCIEEDHHPLGITEDNTN